MNALEEMGFTKSEILKTEQERIEKAKRILEEIESVENRIQSSIDSVNGFLSEFPSLVKSKKHDIGGYKRYQAWLWEKYSKTLGI